MHRVVDPEVAGREEARARLEEALPLLGEAAGSEVTGDVGTADPLAATMDALYHHGFDELLLSMLPRLPVAASGPAEQGPRARLRVTDVEMPETAVQEEPALGGEWGARSSVLGPRAESGW